MKQENKIENLTEYKAILDIVNSFDDIDGLMLDALENTRNTKNEIKVITGDLEISYDYDDFLRIIDTQGFEAL